MPLLEGSLELTAWQQYPKSSTPGAFPYVPYHVRPIDVDAVASPLELQCTYVCCLPKTSKPLHAHLELAAAPTALVVAAIGPERRRHVVAPVVDAAVRQEGQLLFGDVGPALEQEARVGRELPFRLPVETNEVLFSYLHVHPAGRAAACRGDGQPLRVDLLALEELDGGHGVADRFGGIRHALPVAKTGRRSVWLRFKQEEWCGLHCCVMGNFEGGVT